LHLEYILLLFCSPATFYKLASCFAAVEANSKVGVKVLIRSIILWSLVALGVHIDSTPVLQSSYFLDISFLLCICRSQIQSRSQSANKIHYTVELICTPPLFCSPVIFHINKLLNTQKNVNFGGFFRMLSTALCPTTGCLNCLSIFYVVKCK
jgi:hypothetical protein